MTLFTYPPEWVCEILVNLVGKVVIECTGSFPPVSYW